jgi:hypothetical protein
MVVLGSRLKLSSAARLTRRSQQARSGQCMLYPLPRRSRQVRHTLVHPSACFHQPWPAGQTRCTSGMGLVRCDRVAPEAARTCALAGGIGRGAGRRYRRHAVRARARLRTRSASQRRAPQEVQRIATRSVQPSALRRKNAQPCSARPRGASRLARFGSIALITVSSDADFTEGPNIDSSHPAPPAVAGGGDCSREQHGGVLGSL